jgi:hypothetical protein
MSKTAEAVEPPRSIEVSPVAVKVNSEGFCWREILVRAPADAIQDDFRNPAIWKLVQQNRTSTLRKMDRLTILAHNEEWIIEAIVAAATGTSATLRIQKSGSFREPGEVLFSDDTYQIWWEGSGYAVQRKSDGVAMGSKSFPTEALATAHLRSLYPVAVG